MQLRLARLSDLDALIEVQSAGAIQAVAHIFPQDAYPFPRDEIYARWVREIDDPEIEACVIECNDGVVSGFAAMRGNELLHFGTAIHTLGHRAGGRRTQRNHAAAGFGRSRASLPARL